MPPAAAGSAELKAAAARQRFTLLARPDSLAALCDRLLERAERREQLESERIARVVSLVTHDGCQVNALVAYFGELRGAPCGHCSFCLSGEPQRLPERVAPLALGPLVDRRALAALPPIVPGAIFSRNGRGFNASIRGKN